MINSAVKIEAALNTLDGCNHFLSHLSSAAARLAPEEILEIHLSYVSNTHQPVNTSDDKKKERNLLSLAGRCGLTLYGNRCNFIQSTVPSIDADNKIGEVVYFRRRSGSPRWRISSLTQNEYPAFASLFKLVFRQSISKQLWFWKYGNKQGCSVTAWSGMNLVAHYGGIVRNVIAFGKPLIALQVCDAMVAPDQRAVMTKSGAMFQVTSAFLELFQGLGPITLAYGFPNRRAMRLGEKLGLYSEVGGLLELRWLVKSQKSFLSLRTSVLLPDSVEDRDDLNKLWNSMAIDHKDSVIGVRDWHYLSHRFLQHPEKIYELILVRRRLTGTPIGLLVLRKEETAVALVDLVSRAKHIKLLIKEARRLTHKWQCNNLYAWISRQHACQFSSKDTSIRDIEVSIPTNAWVPQPFDTQQLFDRWWLTMGDTDFL